MTTVKQSKSFSIGAFIVGAILLVFIALLFFSGGSMFSQKERVIMYFEGSVQGLQIGAPIKLKGVELGEITDIQINFDNYEENGSNANKHIITTVKGDLVLQRISRKGADINRDFFEEAIGNGMRAQLNFQSFLTGLLYVELDFFPDTEAKLYGVKGDVLELPTVATGFEELSKNLQEINIKGLVDNLDQLSTHLNNVVKSGVVEETLSSVKTAADTFTKTSESVGHDVNLLSKNLTKTSEDLNQLLAIMNKQTPTVIADARVSMQHLQNSLLQLDKASNSIQESFSDDSPMIYQLNSTLEAIERSSRAFRALSETIDERPEALLRGKHSTEEEN